MTDAQASLEHLQALTVECGHTCHDISEGKGCSVCAPNCAGTVPKYSSLQWLPWDDEDSPMAIADINLNALLMDATKVGIHSEVGMGEGEADAGFTKIHDYSEDDDFYARADTPIEAALMALAKAEGLEQYNGN